VADVDERGTADDVLAAGDFGYEDRVFGGRRRRDGPTLKMTDGVVQDWHTTWTAVEGNVFERGLARLKASAEMPQHGFRIVAQDV
jgi:hypothetical protein